MTQESQINTREILEKLMKLRIDVEMLKQKEANLENRLQKKQRLTVVEESLSEIWDNKEDEIWNEY